LLEEKHIQQKFIAYKKYFSTHKNKHMKTKLTTLYAFMLLIGLLATIKA